MANIICDFQTVLGRAVEGTVSVAASGATPAFGTTRILVPEASDPKPLVNGKAEFTGVTPGEATIRLFAAGRYFTFRVMVPAVETVNLSDLLENPSAPPSELDGVRDAIRQVKEQATAATQAVSGATQVVTEISNAGDAALSKISGAGSAAESAIAGARDTALSTIQGASDGLKEALATQLTQTLDQKLTEALKAIPQASPEEAKKAAEKAAEEWLKANPPQGGGAIDQNAVATAVNAAVEAAVKKLPSPTGVEGVFIVKPAAGTNKIAAAINAAIADPAAKTIEIPAGEYELETTVLIGKASGKTIRGQGESTILKWAPPQDTAPAAFLVGSGDGTKNLQIEDLLVKMEWTDAKKPQHCFQITNASNVHLKGVAVEQCGGSAFIMQGYRAVGVAVTGVTSSSIRQCRVDGAGLKQTVNNQASGYGVLVKDNSFGVSVENNYLRNISCGMGIAGTGNDNGSPTYLKISNNTVEMSDSSVGFEPIGLTIGCHNAVITNNSLPVSKDNGISVGAYSLVANNMIGKAWNHGVACSGPGTIITGNHIQDVGGENFTRLKERPADWAAVAIYNPNSCVVSNNYYRKTIDESYAAHMVKIHLEEGHQRSEVGNNSITGNKAAPGSIDPKKAFIQNLNLNPNAPDYTEAVTVGPKEDYTPLPLDAASRYWVPVTYWWADQDFATNSKWKTVFDHIDKAPFFIINPRSGVGDKKEHDFVSLVDKLRPYRKPMLGYVRTIKATVKVESVLADIDKYVQWYGVTGVFLDEMVNGWGTSQNLVPFYQRIYKTVKAKYGEKFVVMGNPGTNTTEDVLNATDILMSFEKDAEKYLNDTEAPVTPDVYRKYPPTRFYHAIHNATQDQMRAILKKASESNVASIYVTNDTFSGGAEDANNNPWDSVPAPWMIDESIKWTNRDPSAGQAKAIFRGPATVSTDKTTPPTTPVELTSVQGGGVNLESGKLQLGTGRYRITVTPQYTPETTQGIDNFTVTNITVTKGDALLGNETSTVYMKAVSLDVDTTMWTAKSGHPEVAIRVGTNATSKVQTLVTVEEL